MEETYLKPASGDWECRVKNTVPAAVITITQGTPFTRWGDELRQDLWSRVTPQFRYWKDRHEALTGIEKQISETEAKLKRLKALQMLCKRKTIKVEYAPREYSFLYNSEDWKDTGATEWQHYESWTEAKMAADKLRLDNPGYTYRIKDREFKPETS